MSNTNVSPSGSLHSQLKTGSITTPVAPFGGFGLYGAFGGLFVGCFGVHPHITVIIINKDSKIIKFFLEVIDIHLLNFILKYSVI
jgi:hypothetical protein